MAAAVEKRGGWGWNRWERLERGSSGGIDNGNRLRVPCSMFLLLPLALRRAASWLPLGLKSRQSCRWKPHK